MDARGIPIDQLQVLLWGALEATVGINPGEYLKQGGAVIGKLKPIVLKFFEILEHLEASAVDGIVSWDEIDVFLVKLRELVQSARALVEAPA
jgi:hypothetical protein